MFAKGEQQKICLQSGGFSETILETEHTIEVKIYTYDDVMKWKRFLHF